ncbi:MAG: hypothetical protein R2693_07350 [Nocardioidaceae bacterium]
MPEIADDLDHLDVYQRTARVIAHDREYGRADEQHYGWCRQVFALY